MGTVVSRLSLRHRCTILRAAQGAVNARGNPEPPDWQPLAIDVACRAWTGPSGRERVTEGTSIVSIDTLRVIVTLDTDVTVRDQLGDITDRGQTIYTGPFQIRAVLPYQDHVELVLADIAS